MLWVIIYGILILLTVLLYLSFKINANRRAEIATRLKKYKDEHGVIDTVTIKEICPHCKSKNVKWDASYRYRTRTIVSGGSGASYRTESRTPEDVYICTCNDCGHVWKIVE